MNIFLKDVDTYQNFMSEKMRKEQEFEDITTDATYPFLSSTGYLQSYSVRLPVHMIAQLEELKKYTPHSTKGEMIFRMLESLIVDFCDTNDDRQAIFEKVGQEALDKRKQEIKEKESKTEE